MKRWLTLLLVASLTVTCVACGGGNDTNADSANPGMTSDAASDNSDDTDNIDEADTTKPGDGLATADIDMYGDIKDTTYMAVVLYNPNIYFKGCDSELYGNPIVAVYDMKTNLAEWNFFTSGTYKFCLGDAHGKFISAVVADGNVGDGTINIEEYSETVEEYDSNRDVISLNVTSNTYTNEWSVYGNGWETLTPNENAAITRIEVDYEVLEEKTISAWMPLTNTIVYDGNFVTNMDAEVANQNFDAVLMTVEDATDLTNPIKTLGVYDAAVASNVVYYQDIVAQNISKTFGLNLLDCESFVHLDSKYVKYANADAGGVAEIYCPEANLFYEVDTAYETVKGIAADSFDYTDKNGDTYTYVDIGEVTDRNTHILYFYKNNAFIGGAEVATTLDGLTPLQMLALLFGLNN